MSVLADIAEVAGEGGDGPVSADELQKLVDCAGEINRDSEKYWTLRLNAEATRFQTWAGQSPDGKQRMEYMGSMPFPFDGASDQRVFWADMLVSEKVRLFSVAAWRAQVNCLPIGANKTEEAWRSTQVLRWFIRNLKQRWTQELIRCANYAKADSPAVCVMKVWWERTQEVELQRLTAGELAQLYVRMAQEQAGDDAAGDIAQSALEFQAAMEGAGSGAADDTGLNELADLLQKYFDVSRARALKTVRQMRQEGEAEFPAPGAWRERLNVKALRYADDFYMPDGATDWAECPVWFEVEWVGKAELQARAEREGWSKTWTEEVLKHECEACFDEYENKGTRVEKRSAELRKGQYQLVTAHYQATNEDNMAARYTCLFHTQVQGESAYGRRLERGTAAVFFSGEIVDGWLLNSRGIPERVGPAAGVLKSMKDDLADSARIMSLPPVTGDGYGTGKEETLSLEPLGYIPLKRGGKLSFMTGPQYPAQMLEAMKGMKEDRDEQFARSTDAVPQDVADADKEYEVMRWLGFLQEVYRAAMTLIAENVSNETLARITDRSTGQPVLPNGREMLASEYDVEVVFDATTLDEERTIKKLNALTQLKQSDTENVLNMTPLIKVGTRALLPHHADEALQQGSEGQESEWKQERDNYLSIRAGVMPRMVDDGTWNYELRLQFYTDLLTANPDAMGDVGEDKREMLETWMKFLGQQATQYGVNRETGRTGVKA